MMIMYVTILFITKYCNCEMYQSIWIVTKELYYICGEVGTNLNSSTVEFRIDDTFFAFHGCSKGNLFSFGQIKVYTRYDHLNPFPGLSNIPRLP